MINLDEVVENQYISEPGEYTLTVKDVDFVETKNGNPCHVFKCVTEDGEMINVSIYLTEKSYWKYKNFLKALGHSGTGTIDERVVSKNCIGKKFVGTVAKQVKENLVTGEMEESKYFEVTKFSRA